MITITDIETGLRDMGLAADSIVLVHSAYKAFGGVVGGPAAVIEAIQNVIGPRGTLVVPTFNFDFSSSGVPFDARTTPSQMGIISEMVRRDPRSRRVIHPVYSFAVLGPLAVQLAATRCGSSYGSASLFGRLVELEGQIMTVGLPYNSSMTFFHHVEEVEGVVYRHVKRFCGEVRDESGALVDEDWQIFVRDVSRGVVTQVEPMGAILESLGLVAQRRIGEATVRLMRARAVYAATVRAMRENPFVLYQVVPEPDADLGAAE